VSTYEKWNVSVAICDTYTSHSGDLKTDVMTSP